MSELFYSLSQQSLLTGQAGSQAMVWILCILSVALTIIQQISASRKALIEVLTRTVRRQELLEEKTLAQMRDDLESLQGVLGDVQERLNTLTESMEQFEDRKRQYLRVRADLKRFFPGEGANGLGGFVFASIANLSRDPITDCQVELIIDGAARGTCHADHVHSMGTRDLRYRLEGIAAADARIGFAITFTDYYSRKWRLLPGQNAEELA